MPPAWSYVETARGASADPATDGGAPVRAPQRKPVRSCTLRGGRRYPSAQGDRPLRRPLLVTGPRSSRRCTAPLRLPAASGCLIAPLTRALASGRLRFCGCVCGRRCSGAKWPCPRRVGPRGGLRQQPRGGCGSSFCPSSQRGALGQGCGASSSSSTPLQRPPQCLQLAAGPAAAPAAEAAAEAPWGVPRKCRERARWRRRRAPAAAESGGAVGAAASLSRRTWRERRLARRYLPWRPRWHRPTGPIARLKT